MRKSSRLNLHEIPHFQDDLSGIALVFGLPELRKQAHLENRTNLGNLIYGEKYPQVLLQSQVPVENIQIIHIVCALVLFWI